MNEKRIKENILYASWLGNKDCFDVLHRATLSHIYDSCGIKIRNIIRELDFHNGVWFTDTFDALRRYTDDILYDWRAGDSPSYETLYRIIESYAKRIIKTGDKVSWREIKQKDFKFTIEYGLVPKQIFPPRKPMPYNYGEGNSVVPDPAAHPIIKHMAQYAPNRANPPIPKPRKYGMIRKRASQKIDLSVFDADLVRIREDCGVYDILLTMDNVTAYEVARKVENGFVVANCLAVSKGSLNELLRDSHGNHAKYIMKEDACNTPRCAAFSSAKMLWNLEEYGFEMMVAEIPTRESIERVEYAIAGAYFTIEPRIYITGVAILICGNKINWDLMLYLARKYKFDGRLLGVMKEVGKHGFDFGREIDILANTGTEPIKSESDTIRDGLRTYNLI